MSLATGLIAFTLRQVCDLGADALGRWVEDRFTDHTRALPRALARANNRTWHAVGLALGGDGLFDRLKDLLWRDADLKAVRDQVKRFLAATPTGLETVEELCAAIRAASPLTVRLGKAAFYRQLPLDEAAAYEAATETMVSNALTHDAQEGMAAFLQKRAPEWAGR